MPHFREVKSVLNKHKKRDGWFLDDYSVNPYEGCSCNCLYCYVRGSKYGENMDEGLAIKSNVITVLEKQLAARAKRSDYGFVAIGSATDAYLHHEEKYGLTRQIIELLIRYRFPAFISTKMNLVKRDLDLLKELDRIAILPADLKDKFSRGVILSVSVSTMNENISKQVEPGAITPAARMQLIKELRMEGFFAGVNAMPVLPYISDSDEALEEIISSAAQHKAAYILIAGLTLFGEGTTDSKTLFFKFLKRYNKDLVPKYLRLFGNKFSLPFDYQRDLKDRADRICKKHRINTSILP